MRKTPPLIALLAVLSVVVSGCAGKSQAPAADAPTQSSQMSIVGVVQDESLAAVPDAQVSLRLLNRTTATDAAGAFRFDGLTVSAYLVDVNATGFETQTLTAEPQATSNASLNFVLRKATFLLPRTEVSHFKGILQCASETLIVSGSCDLLVKTVTGQALFTDTLTFQVGLARRWRSLVVDVDFDPSAHPGFDGLRLAVRGIDDAAGLGDYQQYGRFHGAQPFTARVDVNGTYDDGVGPVPGSLSAVEFTVYPQGYAWHQACDPTGAFGCFAGAGAGTDVDFDLYVTVFYNAPPPDGYTLLGG